LREAVEIFRLQRFAAEISKQFGAAVGDVDRAAEPELGLIEQKRKGMLGGDGILVAPAQDALADRHRMNAELAEGGAFELAVGRMIFDPLHVAAKAVALMQHRHVTVGEPRAFVEMPAGKSAQALKVRLDM